MSATFQSNLLHPIYRSGERRSGFEFNTDATIQVGPRISPFNDILKEQLQTINNALAPLSDGELVLNISGCGHLTETFLLPALKPVVEELPDLRNKLKLILTDAPRNTELAATKNGSGIERVLKDMQIPYEYHPSDKLSGKLSGSIKAVFNATPPALHLASCDWYLNNTGATIFNEKPACLPDQLGEMTSLGSKYPGRLSHIDWVMGTQPFQWLMSKRGQELLERFGAAKLVNSYCVESWQVDPDRNGAPGQFGLIRRNPSIELENGFDLGVGIANDCGIHPYFSALLFEKLTKGEQFTLAIKDSRMQYARARRSHSDYGLFDDTAGTWTFSLGPTLHNVIFGKELNATFFGFDAVSQDSARLLVSFGVPAVSNQFEPNAAEVPPYIVYVPGTNSSGPGECHVFDYTSKDLYVGIIVNLLATALELPDSVRPNFPETTNQLCLTGVERLANEKRRAYEIAGYEEYEPGHLPSMIPGYSRDFGVPANLSKQRS